MDYRDNRQRWAESHQVVHFYAGQWCTFTPALTLGYTYSYLLGRTGLRGLFMSLSLLALYGIASYLAISLFV